MSLLLDTTVYDKDMKKQVEAIIGPPYSFLERLRSGGVGSHRMIVEHLSEEISFIRPAGDLLYGNIELRKEGIAVHFNRRYARYSWLIPYYQLHWYDTNLFSIHASGDYVKFRKDKNYKMNAKFMKKLREIRAEYLQKYEMPR